MTSQLPPLPCPLGPAWMCQKRFGYKRSHRQICELERAAPPHRAAERARHHCKDLQRARHHCLQGARRAHAPAMQDQQRARHPCKDLRGRVASHGSARLRSQPEVPAGKEMHASSSPWAWAFGLGPSDMPTHGLQNMRKQAEWKMPSQFDNIFGTDDLPAWALEALDQGIKESMKQEIKHSRSQVGRVCCWDTLFCLPNLPKPTYPTYQNPPNLPNPPMRESRYQRIKVQILPNLPSLPNLLNLPTPTQPTQPTKHTQHT